MRKPFNSKTFKLNSFTHHNIYNLCPRGPRGGSHMVPWGAVSALRPTFGFLRGLGRKIATPSQADSGGVRGTCLGTLSLALICRGPSMKGKNVVPGFGRIVGHWFEFITAIYCYRCQKRHLRDTVFTPRGGRGPCTKEKRGNTERGYFCAWGGIGFTS